MNKEIKEIFEIYENEATNPDLVILIKTLKEWYFEKEDYKSRIDKAIEILKKHKADLDYEPWSIYQIRGSILFDLANVLESKNGKERNTKTDS